MNLHHNFQLQPLNSFRTKATSKLFASPESTEEIIELLKQYPNEEKLILGNGCNMFFTKDFDGLIIKPMMSGINILEENSEYVEIEVGAAQDWDELVDYCVNKGWSGIENLSLIPGAVGAAPIQNIGAYGTEVKDVIISVNTIHISTQKEKTFSNAECEFEYRNSIFKQTREYIITSVVFRLNKSFTYQEKYVDLNKELSNNTSPSLKQVREAIIKIRTRKLPNHLELPNAGSFFKNPIITTTEKEALIKLLPNAPIYNVSDNCFKTSAAYLIEQAGYKGKRNDSGNVGTYENHALIIVNYGSEDGNDIADFMNEIKQVVKEKYNIELEAEVWVF